MTEERLIRVEERLIRVEEQLDKIIELLDGKVGDNCEKMGSHIDFIEHVYETVKHPLGYMCSIISNDKTPLPIKSSI